MIFTLNDILFLDPSATAIETTGIGSSGAQSIQGLDDDEHEADRRWKVQMDRKSRESPLLLR